MTPTVGRKKIQWEDKEKKMGRVADTFLRR